MGCDRKLGGQRNEGKIKDPFECSYVRSFDISLRVSKEQPFFQLPPKDQVWRHVGFYKQIHLMLIFGFLIYRCYLASPRLISLFVWRSFKPCRNNKSTQTKHYILFSVIHFLAVSFYFPVISFHFRTFLLAFRLFPFIPSSVPFFFLTFPFVFFHFPFSSLHVPFS